MNFAILVPKMVTHGSEVHIACTLRVPEWFQLKKFDPIWSSINNFLKQGLRGEIQYQYVGTPLWDVGGVDLL
ncbi:MAG: hypothetical protein GY820_11065 [Gammaproteobacteria bacterium]|nr:hypothetical protein [Gammaproteobacteria bacterium]